MQVREQASGRLLVADSSFSLSAGSCLAIVGESGSGKSLTCRALMRLRQPGLAQSGKIMLNGSEISGLPERELNKLRGRRMCMIMQNGMRAFDPGSTLGRQLRAIAQRHYGWGRTDTDHRMRQALSAVGLSDPAAVLRSYAHELSGGMLQRVMIAVALVLEPDVILADEPTTALDAVVQYEVVQQLKKLRARTGCAMIIVSHDLAVVRHLADEMLVMKNGRIVESGETSQLFAHAKHPYTRELIEAKEPLTLRFHQLLKGEGVC